MPTARCRKQSALRQQTRLAQLIRHIGQHHQTISLPSITFFRFTQFQIFRFNPQPHQLGFQKQQLARFFILLLLHRPHPCLFHRANTQCPIEYPARSQPRDCPAPDNLPILFKMIQYNQQLHKKYLKISSKLPDLTMLSQLSLFRKT